jgi:serine/threonine protein kinase
LQLFLTCFVPRSLEIIQDNFEFVRMDAIVAERLTFNPRIFNIYGFCANTILSEFFPHGDLESSTMPEGEDASFIDSKDLHDEDSVKPRNNFTGLEKLDIATQMAEGIAILHGYSGGAIVHNDVQLAQFLFSADKSILKLNDFNRAEFMLWDDEHQEYCRYKNGRGHGNVSPKLCVAYFLDFPSLSHGLD